MNLIRKAHRNSLLLWLLAATVGMRALIAPGFMLEVNGNGPLGLAIVFCDGVNGLAPSAPANDPHAIHKHHSSESTKQEVANGLTGATCGLWSTSSTFVETIAFASDHLVPTGPDQFLSEYRPVTTQLFRQQPQQPRAPPVALII